MSTGIRTQKIGKTHPSVGTLVVIIFTGYKGCPMVSQKLLKDKYIKVQY